MSAGTVYGNIYDCNMKKLNNNEYKFIAVVNPTPNAASEIITHVLDKEDFYSKLKFGKPFTCEVDTDSFRTRDITVFKIPVRNSDSEAAVHLLGYSSDGQGKSGLEYAYNDYIRNKGSENSVVFSIDGAGKVIGGLDQKTVKNPEVSRGVVTSLDYNIQKICEESASGIEKGAVVVMDISTGDIKALVSKPDYKISTLSEEMKDESSPLINRAFCAYNVGSIFKLVVASAAFESGLDDFTYECTGSLSVADQTFRCHKSSGHGKQNILEAMVNSCNPYFITLAQNIDSELLLNTAKACGFGSSSKLAEGIVSESGNLQTLSQLSLPAEKANMAFGQGVLTATPLQITRLCCALANNGKMPVPRLVIGTTEDETTINIENKVTYAYAMAPEVAQKVKDLMGSTVEFNPDSDARPNNTTAAGKTSTAQTGKYDENGNELCHAWITGYFPINEPKYAVTVLVENGGGGNKVAGPVFKDIAERITDLPNK